MDRLYSKKQAEKTRNLYPNIEALQKDLSSHFMLVLPTLALPSLSCQRTPIYGSPHSKHFPLKVEKTEDKS